MCLFVFPYLVTFYRTVGDNSLNEIPGVSCIAHLLGQVYCLLSSDTHVTVFILKESDEVAERVEEGKLKQKENEYRRKEIMRQTCMKLLQEVTAGSCCSKLLLRVTARSYCYVLLQEVTAGYCCSKLLPRVTARSYCWFLLLEVTATCYCNKLLLVLAARSYCKKLLLVLPANNNTISYETLLHFLQRNGTYFLNKARIYMQVLPSGETCVALSWVKICGVCRYCWALTG
jgi:hypothetical protein